MIGIKRIYDPVAPDDGRRILVDRLWPRGLRREEARIDGWLRDLAPSDELRKWFGHDPARWRRFKSRYAHELARQCDELESLRRDARRGAVTLVYAALDRQYNNAAALKEVLEEGAPLGDNLVC